MAKKKKVVFNVYGTSYKLDNIRQIGIPNPDYDLKPKALWEKYSEGSQVWQYRFDITDVQLIPEPTNPADPNAIMVLMNGVHVGYINRNSTDAVRGYMSRSEVDHITGFMKGGKAKNMCVSNTGNKYIRNYDHEYYEASVTLHLKDGIEPQEFDTAPPKDEGLGYSPKKGAATQAAASSGCLGCLIPVLAGIAAVGAVIAML